MKKVVALDWNSFMSGSLEPKKVISNVAPKVAGLGTLALTAPVKVLAVTSISTSSSWNGIFLTAMGIADWLCVGVIMFSGVTWMFGNRTKAIELLIGTCSGYLIVRHSMDIMQWLRGI